MIFYYAAGGGLGHLTRARAIFHTLQIHEGAVILTSSEFASDRRITGDHEVIPILTRFASDVAAYRVWLRDLFNEYQPAAIYLDAFPVGIIGEFCDFDFPRHTSLYHIARLLRWEGYSKLLCGKTPQFKKTYVLEELAAAHEEFLYSCSSKVEPLRLQDPEEILTASEQELIESLKNAQQPLWLVVHAGKADEIRELVAYAEACRQIETPDTRLILIAPACPDDLRIEHYPFYPAYRLFPYAERIVTACGFHSMRQTEPYKQKHRFMPFARQFDNQFERAARRHREMKEGEE
jgi:hypothetical protein